MRQTPLKTEKVKIAKKEWNGKLNLTVNSIPKDNRDTKINRSFTLLNKTAIDLTEHLVPIKVFSHIFLQLGKELTITNPEPIHCSCTENGIIKAHAALTNRGIVRLIDL